MLMSAYVDGRLTKEEFDERSDELFSSRTVDDIADLTADLALSGDPVHASQQMVVPQHNRELVANVVTGAPGQSLTVALMGGSTRAGHWTCAAEHTAATMWGGIQIDLREADFSAQHTTIRCFAVMGGIELLVPDDLDVRSSGVAIMGGFVSDPLTDSPLPARPGAPVVEITGLALMGGVEIKRVPRQGELTED